MPLNRACCVKVEVVYELKVTDDWLQEELHGS